MLAQASSRGSQILGAWQALGDGIGNEKSNVGLDALLYLTALHPLPLSISLGPSGRTCCKFVIELCDIIKLKLHASPREGLCLASARPDVPAGAASPFMRDACELHPTFGKAWDLTVSSFC